MDDNVFALLAFSTTLTFSLVVAFTVKEFLATIFSTIVRTFTRLFTTSIEVHVNYGITSNVTNWLRQIIKHKCRSKLCHFGATNDLYHFKQGGGRLSRSYGFGGDGDSEDKKEEDHSCDTCDIKKQLEPLQTSQSVFFFYKRTYVRVTRNINPDIQSQRSSIEVYKITAYGTRNKKLLIQMLSEGRKMMERKPSKHINYYKAEHQMGHSSWRLVKRIQPRALSSIILKDGLTDAMQKDLEDFIKSKEWYKERGIPYRRGYLLYGPPGCGKTSFVKAIAGQIGFDIFEMQLSSRGLTDESLHRLMSTMMSEKSILLFEDVDAVFVPRHQDEERSGKDDGLLGKLKIREPKGQLSFSGLLNAIDGVASEEDYIVFMTTNQIEKLDSALIRPGRIDMRQFIDYPDEQQIAAFFKRFYPGCSDAVADTFAKAVNNLNCNPSVAQIQGIFLRHKHEPEDNLLDVDMLIDVCKSNADLGIHDIYL